MENIQNKLCESFISNNTNTQISNNLISGNLIAHLNNISHLLKNVQNFICIGADFKMSLLRLFGHNLILNRYLIFDINDISENWHEFTFLNESLGLASISQIPYNQNFIYSIYDDDKYDVNFKINYNKNKNYCKLINVKNDIYVKSNSYIFENIDNYFIDINNNYTEILRMHFLLQINNNQVLINNNCFDLDKLLNFILERYDIHNEYFYIIKNNDFLRVSKLNFFNELNNNYSGIYIFYSIYDESIYKYYLCNINTANDYFKITNYDDSDNINAIRFELANKNLLLKISFGVTYQINAECSHIYINDEEKIILSLENRTLINDTVN